jgi:hypothetical protein
MTSLRGGVKLDLMKKLSLYVFLVLMFCNTVQALPKCVGEASFEWKNCKGTITFDSGSKYVGEIDNGIPHGYGTYTSDDGSKYIGEFKVGGKHGTGTFSFSNGDKYVGEFKDNEYHGQGTYTSTEGNKFVGEYKNGLMDGFGVFTFSDGMKYEGGFNNDEFHGAGTVTSPDGNASLLYFNKGEIVQKESDIEKVDESLDEEFTIAGIRFKDSLLNYFTKDQIDQHSHFNLYQYKKDRKFFVVAFIEPEITKEYQVIQLLVKKNDKNYKIHGISGVTYFVENIQDCYKEEKKLFNTISKIYPYKEKVNVNEAFTAVDDKSNMKGTGLFLKSGDVVNIVCYDWSDESQKDDNLKISFLTEELNDWIQSDM